MAHAPTAIRITVELELTHICPPAGSGLTPCCGHTPFELPRWHRMTEDMALVTCPGAWGGRPTTTLPS